MRIKRLYLLLRLLEELNKVYQIDTAHIMTCINEEIDKLENVSE